MILVEIGHFFGLEFLSYKNRLTIIWMVPAESQFPGLFKVSLNFVHLEKLSQKSPAKKTQQKKYFFLENQ